MVGFQRTWWNGYQFAQRDDKMSAQIRSRFSLACWILFFLLMLSGCDFDIQSSNSNITVTSSPTLLAPATPPMISASPSLLPTFTLAAIATNQPTQTPTSTNTVTPTLAPTMDEETSKGEVFKLLQDNGGCELPCFWGITPGETDTITAIQFFQQMGWRDTSYRNQFGNFIDTYFQDLDQFLGISITLENNLDSLSSLSIGIGSNQFNHRVGYFGLKNILETFGQPDRIALSLAVGLEIETPLNTGYTLWLFYDDLGVMFKYSGTAQKYGDGYRICPSHPNEQSLVYSDDFGDVGILILSNSISETLEDTYWRFGGDAKGVKPIEDATGINVSEFYQQALEKIDQRFCFDTPREVWP